jgi:DNA-binding PadR family transcriptional regulator
MSVDHALLSLLVQREAHGYELMQRYEDAGLGSLYHLEMSNLYAILKRLEAEGWTTFDLQPQGTRPPRKVYAATDGGRAAFADWLQVPVTRIRDIRVEFMLKLYFARQQPAAVLERLLDRQIGACHVYLTHIDDELAATSDEFEETVLLVRRRHAQHTIAWLSEYQRTGELSRALVIDD